MKTCNYFFLLFLQFSFIVSGQLGQSEIGSNKLVVSVKDFNAKGDGLQDDSEAFQKAIYFCEKNGRKTLFIPFGKYSLKKSVTFKKGGVQILGEGALLREETWWEDKVQNQISSNGSEIIVSNNNIGFIFDKNVKDPVRIADVQFRSKNGRQVGGTTGILFQSEWVGPTWPFIIERCHFTGFNFAVKFSAANQYLVAFVQLRQNAFNQNDECIYFSDINWENKQVGIRNLSWGFTFENNVCHDNSRVICGAFAKDAVNILNNNMEGNIAYANGKKPQHIVDLEISNATVNFEGNHFESIISDAVYVSSVFKDKKGKDLPIFGTTAMNNSNKIFIKGNNFDGIGKEYKPFTLKGLLVYNYDQVNLYLDACDLRINEANQSNIYLSNEAEKTGTVIKIPIKSSDLSIATNSVTASKKIINNDKNYKLITATTKNENLMTGHMKVISSKDQYLVAKIKILNQNGTQFLGLSTIFTIKYYLDNEIKTMVKTVRGNYGYKLGENYNIAIIPNFLPENAKNATFTAEIEYNKDILGEKSFYVKSVPELFTEISSEFTINNFFY